MIGMRITLKKRHPPIVFPGVPVTEQLRRDLRKALASRAPMTTLDLLATLALNAGMANPFDSAAPTLAQHVRDRDAAFGHYEGTMRGASYTATCVVAALKGMSDVASVAIPETLDVLARIPRPEYNPDIDGDLEFNERWTSRRMDVAKWVLL